MLNQLKRFNDWLEHKTDSSGRRVKRDLLWILFLDLVILVFIMWVANWIWLEIDHDRGTWGDMFGGASALFSGLALAGIIYTIFLQHRDLELTRAEMRQQKFDGIFFQLLRIHNDIINSIDLTKSGGSAITGRDCFRIIRYKLINQWPSKPHTILEDELGKIQELYKAVFKKYQSDLSHYFRNLYNLIKFVHTESEMGKIERQKYINLVKAQMSSDELVLLFYNNLSPHGNRKFKPLAEEYALFKNLDKRNLLIERHTRFYEDGAFSYTDEKGTVIEVKEVDSE